MPFRTVDGETKLCLVENAGTAEEVITFVFAGGDGTSKSTAVEVTTFRQLLDANDDSEMVDKYIKVMNDMNVSTESWYTGYTDTITYKNYIFADSQKTISGLTVIGSGYGFIHGQTGTSPKAYTFENINFYDCVFKATSSPSSNGGVISSKSTSSTMINCNVSVRYIDNGYALSDIINTTSFNNCSIYIVKAPSSITITNKHITVSSSNTSTNSNFVFDGFNLSCTSSTASTGSWLNRPNTSCSYIYKNCDINNTQTSFLSYTTSNNTPVGCYYAFSNCTFTTTPIPVNCDKLVIIAGDDTSIFNNNSSSNAVIATTVDSDDPTFNTTSVKSKQFLIDCGFLP